MIYHYTMCGLDYVYLRGGVREYDTDYGKGIAIENADELDRVIAAEIITSQSRIRGQEVRFLRALLHFSQTELANELGIKRLTVARWENSRNTPIPGPADRALRVVVARCLYEVEGLVIVAEVFSEITDNQPDRRLEFYFRPDFDDDEPALFPEETAKGKNWKPKKRAA